MAASVRVILSARVAWAVSNDAAVVENVRTASMMVRKSYVEIVICCGGGAEVLTAAPSVGAVLGPWGLEKTEGRGAGSVGARGGEAGTEGVGACGSSVCSTRGVFSSVGISATGWSSTGRGTERGKSHHRSTIMLATESR